MPAARDLRRRSHRASPSGARVSGEKTSVTWQFTAGTGTNIDTWWGTIPDFNGDGKADVAVGTTSGSVYVYYGSAQGLGATPTPLTIADAGDFIFGAGLASGGDVNGDGFADLLVAAPVKPAGGVGSRIYVYLGGKDGVATTPFKKINFDEYYLETLYTDVYRSITRGGADINGDGYSDFLVTSPRAGEFAAYSSFFGSGGDVLRGPRNAYEKYTNSEFGRSFAFCDLNGDRRTDMVLAVSNESDPIGPRNSLVTFKGAASNFNLWQEIAYKVEDGDYGRQTACADFAGDGYPEALSSTFSSGRRDLYAGDVIVYNNRAGFLDSTEVSLNGQVEGPGASSGRDLSVVGDMDGDGIPELAVGEAIGTEPAEQVIRVMFGMKTPTVADYIEIGGTPDIDGEFGRASTGGDVDGDGLADLAVGSPAFKAAGRITIFRGSRASRIVSPSAIHIDAPKGATDFGRWLSAGF